MREVGPEPAPAAVRALTASAAFWFAVAALGQWVFVYYIAVFYGASSLSGDFAAWRRNTHLIKGYVPGDTIGNLAFAAHALLAGYVAFGGAIQLIPAIRARAPALHRWNGRVFLGTALGLSLTGLYMVWGRGAAFDLVAAGAISLNAALIVVFGGLAWRAAVRRDFASHRRWALRTYLVANGQWFIRVGVIAWVIVNQGHAKIGPFFSFWQFGCYLVPLAVLELYLRAKDSAGPGGRYAMAGVLGVLTLVMGAGIAGAYLFIWRPYL
jgi:Predicted membrane protein (DUF2306)